ncbi:MAG: hypothetical protein HQL37_08680 [Alphaproteobacteria bacterium]|nr:hypothetical protein [Alphaproteobacteria bacterium]
MVAATRFIPRAERIAKVKADEARQGVLALGLPESVTEDIMVAIARHETGGVLPAWKFNMISPEQCLAVWDAIRQMDRPELTRHVFDLVLTHIEPNTGAVTLTREEISDRVGTEPRNVSTVMTQLEEHKVIFRRRLKVAGMRGRGPVRYYLNPHVAWNGKLEVRVEESKQMPLPFAVIEGGKGAEP